MHPLFFKDIDAPVGKIRLIASNKGLAAILWEGEDYKRTKLEEPIEDNTHPILLLVEQQVSLASALAALKKLQEKTIELTPDAILQLSDEEMRACYVSRQKNIYIRGLANALVKNEIDLKQLQQLTNDQVRATLIELKGIGNWTIDVYLMFVLQRVDIFPIGDLAVINAIKKLKQLPKSTEKETIQKMSEDWKPYRTVASMLLWHYYLSSNGSKLSPL